jgi:hypothetical protein
MQLFALGQVASGSVLDVQSFINIPVIQWQSGPLLATFVLMSSTFVDLLGHASATL